MTPIRLLSLYSGSSGNAALIVSPCGTLLIDAGKSAKRLSASLIQAGVSPDEIDAILLTHEHNDHVSALSVFLKAHPIPVHLPIGCAEKLISDPAISPCLCPHPPVFEQTLAGMHVRSFATPHDSRASVGYRIEIPTEDGIFCIGYATDIGHVSATVEENLFGCDAVVLESNHDPDMLHTGPYPYYLKTRIASRRGHLSNPESALLAARLAAGGTNSLLLAHLSAENNTPQLAYDECFSAVADERVQICVASPDEITELPLEVPV